MSFKLLTVLRNHNFKSTESLLGFSQDDTQNHPRHLGNADPGVAIGTYNSQPYVYYIDAGTNFYMQELNVGTQPTLMADSYQAAEFRTEYASTIATAQSTIIWFGAMMNSIGVASLNSSAPDKGPQYIAKMSSNTLGPLTLAQYEGVRNRYVVNVYNAMISYTSILYTSGSKFPRNTTTTNHGAPDQVICVLCNSDKRLEMFYVDDNGQIWHRWESVSDVTSNIPSFSEGPVALNGCFVNKQKPRVVGTKNQDGRLEIFFVGQDGSVYQTYQTNNYENGGWGMPVKLYADTDARDVMPTYNADKSRIEVYILTKDQQVKVKHQVTGGWTTEQVIHNFDLEDNFEFLTMENETSGDTVRIVATTRN